MPRLCSLALQAVKDLELWLQRQASALDLAANPDSLQQNFDKLLKVCGAGSRQGLDWQGCRHN